MPEQRDTKSDNGIIVLLGKYRGSIEEISGSYRCNVVRPLHVLAKAGALREGELGEKLTATKDI